MRRGRADGSRLVGWDAVRARDRARSAAPRPRGRFARFDPARWLTHYHASLDPPTPTRPYWTVRTTAGTFLGAGQTPSRAVRNARTRLRTPPTPSP